MSNVLFLCTGNSCRSQMAEALLCKHAGNRFTAFSAGVEPKGIHPLTIKVLGEIGIDTSKLRSKDVAEYLGKLPVHQLIVVCENAEGSCPRIFPGMLDRQFWPFDDPPAFQGTDEEKLNKFREVRDKIDQRIQQWLKQVKD
jgi:arsenate reductase (thioredoxin)